MKAHVSEKKKAVVKQLSAQLKDAHIIGILNMESLPARNLAAMRKKLRGNCDIVMAKKRLIKLALAQSHKKDIEKLEPFLKGMPALLITKENPFSLFKTLKKNQSKAPIRPGQAAPYDIIIPAGPTSFPPGPIIGELGQMGIKAGIEEGKVAIKVDAVVAHAGDIVDEKRAGLITRFGIEPIRIGLTLTAVYENGEVLTGAVLDIDEDKFMHSLQHAASEANSLAFTITWPTKDNIKKLVQKAYWDSVLLASSRDILTDSNVKELLAKAYGQAQSIAAHVPNNDT